MNYFWGNVFDYVKERRNAMLFFGTLVLLPGLLFLAFFIYVIGSAFNP